MNEYDFDIQYIKGKSNCVADYLSRIEVNACDNDDDVRSDLATIHSGQENLDDHVYITESPVNIYKHQIIIENGNSNTYLKKIIFQRKIRHIIKLKNYEECYVLKVLRDIFPIKGTVGVFCDNFDIFKSLQETLVKYFSNIAGMRILKCCKYLTDISRKTVFLKQLKNTIHKYIYLA